MVEKLEHEKLETITLHNSAVHWYKENKEIIVNSTLFDVHRYQPGKDSTVFTGLFDIKETELKNQVKKLLEQRDENNASRELTIAKLLLQLWITDNEDCNFSVSNALIENKRPIVRPGNLLTVAIFVPFPPPRS